MDHVRAAVIRTLQEAIRKELRVPACGHDDGQYKTLDASQMNLVWRVVVRSGSVDVTRTQLGCVGRKFHRFISRLRFDQLFQLVF